MRHLIKTLFNINVQKKLKFCGEIKKVFLPLNTFCVKLFKPILINAFIKRKPNDKSLENLHI